MNNVVDKITAAMKGITRASLGQGLLTEEKASRFIRQAENATPLLQKARRLTMNSHTRDIDRIAFGGRLLQATAGETTDITNEQGVNTYLNQLLSAELGGFVSISDAVLEDNIERQSLENTIVDLTAAQVGRDLEYLFLAGDKTKTGDALLKVTDGWLKKSANQIVGASAPTTAGQFDQTKVMDLLDKLLLVVPKKYMRDSNLWAYQCSWEVINDYRDALGARTTNLGDSALIGAQTLYYKGIRLEYTPQMPAGTVLLAPAENLVYGLYRDVRIEPDRVAKARKTDFVVTCRADCNYEDENASAVATGYTGGAA